MLVAREKPATGYFLEEKYRRNYLPETHLNPVSRRREKASSSAGVTISNLKEILQLSVLLLLLMAIGVGLISQHGRIVACNYRIHQLQGDIVLLQEEKESLCIETQRLGSLERIEKIAVGELGLQYPDKKQWLVLSLPVNEN